MSHENSRTIEQNGRYYNIAVRPAAIAAGGIIGGARGGSEVLTPIFPWERWWYPTLTMAVEAARRRSEAMGHIEESIKQRVRDRVRDRRGVRETLAHAFGRAANIARRHRVSVTAIEREEAAKEEFRRRWGIGYEEWLKQQQGRI